MATSPGTAELGLEEHRARHERGAYFTPPDIARFLTRWAIGGQQSPSVLDPSCGDGAFLHAAMEHLQHATGQASIARLVGIDIDVASLDVVQARLSEVQASVELVHQSFFAVSPPGSFFPSLGQFDCVVGNPPFVRYQLHAGEERIQSIEAALRQGVRLSGLASSWAATLVHASAFLKPEGRLAMVLPAELLTVGYAEPIRRWLHGRFASVKLIVFDRLQFADATENVVLLLASGTGGCDAFSLYYANDAADLWDIQAFDETAVSLPADGKWTDFFLNRADSGLYQSVTRRLFQPLESYGRAELGTVTGANHFFTMTESTRVKYNLAATKDVVRLYPPGRHSSSRIVYTESDWESEREAGDRVWLFAPNHESPSEAALRYIDVGAETGVSEGYKCRKRAMWWRPPAVGSPDLFFTYMSHQFPRLIANEADVTFLNSMHGIRLRQENGKAKKQLALLSLNSVTLLGAELLGRSYGGGVLKMEPREAGTLPVPSPELLAAAWSRLGPRRNELRRLLDQGLWTSVMAQVDKVLLTEIGELPFSSVNDLTMAGHALRARRVSKRP